MDQKFRSLGLLFTFLGVIYFPIFNSYTHWIQDVPNFENRKHKPKPDFDSTGIDSFPQKFTDYYNDTFDLRNQLIRYHNYLNIELFRQAPVNSVIIGKDNWLFLSNEELDSYLGTKPLEYQQLQWIKEELEYRSDYLKKRGVKFYFMIVPSKISIYSDMVGYEYHRIGKKTWGEQLNSHLKSSSILNLIDVFDTLRLYRYPDNLYFKLDNHWNQLGGLFTARQLVLKMKKDFPLLEPLKLEEFAMSKTVTINGNINKMVGYLDLFTENNITLNPLQGYQAVDGELGNYQVTPGFAYPWEFQKVKQVKDSDKPKLLIICDSFGDNIFPFLSESFSKTVKIWDAWQYKLNEDIVNSEKPDAVLLMISEPIIHNLLDAKNASKPR